MGKKKLTTIERQADIGRRLVEYFVVVSSIERKAERKIRVCPGRQRACRSTPKMMWTNLPSISFDPPLPHDILYTIITTIPSVDNENGVRVHVVDVRGARDRLGPVRVVVDPAVDGVDAVAVVKVVRVELVRSGCRGWIEERTRHPSPASGTRTRPTA
jgi:hypothetical protein